MSNDTENPMERELREFAEQRRARAAREGSAGMDPVMRRRLLDEAMRTHRPPEPAPRRGWFDGWFAVGSRWAVGGAVFAALALVSSVWWMGQRGGGVRRENESLVVVDATQVGEELSRSVPTKDLPAGGDGAGRAAASSPVVLSKLEDSTLQRTAPVSKPAPATQARRLATNGPTPSLAFSPPTPTAPRLAGPALDSKLQASSSAPPVAAPAARALRAELSQEARRDQGTASASRAADLGSFSNQLGGEKVTVLNRFRMQQTGDRIEVVDADGSAYVGNVVVASAPAGSVEREKKGSSKESTSKPTGSAVLEPVQGMASEGLQTQRFVVSGTNRTTRQRVVFRGTIEAMAGVPVDVLAAVPTQSPARSYDLQRVPEENQVQSPQAGRAGAGGAAKGKQQQQQAQVQPSVQLRGQQGQLTVQGAGQQQQVVRVMGNAQVGERLQFPVQAVPGP